MITLLHGDCRAVLPTLPAGSVQCVITSPPYYGLRKYTDDANEIGTEATPQAYVAALVAVFAEVWRVLRDDGVLWVNLGDSYGRGTRVNWSGDATRGTNAHKAVTDAGSYGAAAAILPEKNLLGMPWRVAFALQDAGWILRSDVIWSKPNPMPESVTDRPPRAHEYVFLFAKQPRYFYDAAAIAEAATHTGGGVIATPDKAARNGQTNNGTGRTTIRSKESATRNRRTVWTIATHPYAGAHFATMPEALIEPCILAGSRAGDTILDPFAGSGTVMRVAERFGRDAIGIDLNQDYLELQQQRTDKVQKELFT
jgi:DNA modification methylase